MKMTIHEAEFRPTSYARFVWRDQDLHKLRRRIADECRKNWEGHDWSGYGEEGEFDDEAPEIPGTDEEVLDKFFWGDSDTADGEPWIEWEQFAIDLSPPEERSIDLTVENCFCVSKLPQKLTTTRYKGSSARLDGTLLEGGGIISDVLEGFLLALTAAGAPVHLPEFHQALKDYCEVLANREVE